MPPLLLYAALPSLPSAEFTVSPLWLSLQHGTEPHREMLEASLAVTQHHQFADVSPGVVDELLDRQAYADAVALLPASSQHEHFPSHR